MLTSLCLLWALTADLPDAAVVPAVDASATGKKSSPIRVLYDVKLVPNERLAKVEIRLEHEGRVPRITLSAVLGQHMGFTGDGSVEEREDGTVIWIPPVDRGSLRFSTRIDHARSPESYDSRCATDWALFRGDGLIPRIKTRKRKGAKARAELQFTLPKGWDVVTSYKRKKGTTASFSLPTSTRAFARPLGWILAGEIRAQSEEISGVEVTVASPKKRGTDRREMLAFLTWTMPKVAGLVDKLPKRLLVVGAGDPMWRGGLSAPSSLYLHGDRPLVENDGTSPLLHEIFHVVTDARAAPDGDWFVEGLAELYSIELLYRAGGLSETARASAHSIMKRRAKRAGPLLVDRATGPTMAKAVVVLKELDEEMRKATAGKVGLDDVVKRLAKAPAPLTSADFRNLVEELAGRSFQAFFEERVGKIK